MSAPWHPVRMVAHVRTPWAPRRVSVWLALMDMTVIMVGQPFHSLIQMNILLLNPTPLCDKVDIQYIIYIWIATNFRL